MTLYTCPGPLRTFAFVLEVTMGLHGVGVGVGVRVCVSDAVAVKIGVGVSVGVKVGVGDEVSVSGTVVGVSLAGTPLGRLQLMTASQMARIAESSLCLFMILSFGYIHYPLNERLIQ